jgi:hypothetical protein
MVKSMGGLTTHSTGAQVSCLLIVNLSVTTLCARPVNSGVRHASRKQENQVMGGEAQKEQMQS